jgi:hypothetical protein
MPTSFETFIVSELPVRPVMLTYAITSYDGDPTLGGAPDIVKLAPKGSFYLQDTGAVLWKKNTGSSGDWAEVAGAAGSYVLKAGDTMSGILTIAGNDDAGSLVLKRTETILGSVNPQFQIGTIVAGGVNLPMLKFTYSDDNVDPHDCFIVESSGTVASVSDGDRRSHYEAFLITGNVDPLFRLNSSPYMQLELGPGGRYVAIGDMTRTSNVIRVQCATNHDLGVGSYIHFSNDEANFAAVLPPSSAEITATASPFVVYVGGSGWFKTI